MELRKLGPSGLQIAPLVLGGNVFGWTADKATSFVILDAFLDAGFNAIDTADVYSRFIPGNKGGESETILGEWMKERGNRAKVVMITKVGMDMGDGKKGLKPAYIAQAVEDSLRRLQTDYIDLYLSHAPDAETPIEDTLGAYQALIGQGKIRSAGGSNYDAAGLKAALDAGDGQTKARYSTLQPHYNLLERKSYQGALEDLCAEKGIGVIPYFALASGFLTGKYRSEADLGKSMRGGRMKGLLNERGFAILKALDSVAGRHDATPAQIALAWLMARPSVTAPIASATSVDQVKDIVKSAEVKLTPGDIAELDATA
jgi:aryl-alcohol dehydrogenase-like predicted oxidoreductase